MKSLLVLGSTGSIGTQTLDVVRAHREHFRVDALAADTSWERVVEQVREFTPRIVAMSDPRAAAALRAALEREGGEMARVSVLEGADALEEITRSTTAELVVHGVVGGAGLRPSVAALESGRDLALANKESLVMAGAQLMELARRNGARILPVDSELCAMHQCMRGERIDRVRRVHLTASGGPFRELPVEDFTGVTPEMALRHPNWVMGPRITVGSATLMNKALEVIEVHHLLGLERERIHVVIHPQSVVHSMVEFVDGSVMAQMGPPDMRGPLHYCLFHPERAPADLVGFDIGLFSRLTFEEPDRSRFPALELGYRCVDEGEDSGSVLNAADEVAVEAFLNERITFLDIGRVNARVLDRRPGWNGDVASILRADSAARDLARSEIDTLGVRS